MSFIENKGKDALWFVVEPGEVSTNLHHYRKKRPLFHKHVYSYCNENMVGQS